MTTKKYFIFTYFINDIPSMFMEYKKLFMSLNYEENFEEYYNRDFMNTENIMKTKYYEGIKSDKKLRFKNIIDLLEKRDKIYIIYFPPFKIELKIIDTGYEYTIIDEFSEYRTPPETVTDPITYPQKGDIKIGIIYQKELGEGFKKYKHHRLLICYIDINYKNFIFKIILFTIGINIVQEKKVKLKCPDIFSLSYYDDFYFNDRMTEKEGMVVTLNKDSSLKCIKILNYFSELGCEDIILGKYKTLANTKMLGGIASIKSITHKIRGTTPTDFNCRAAAKGVYHYITDTTGDIWQNEVKRILTAKFNNSTVVFNNSYVGINSSVGGGIKKKLKKSLNQKTKKKFKSKN
jgi:hypothetical protein